MDKVQQLLEQRIRSDVRDMQAYRVVDARGMIKLDAMENPYTLPSYLQQELGERLGALAVNRYPADGVKALRQALHRALQTGNEGGGGDAAAGELVLGNGSDELIHLLCMACAAEGAAVLAPMPGFVMYQLSAQFNHLRFVGVDLQADFSLDVPAMQQALQTHRPALLYLAYPNNPTANLWAVSDIEALIERARTTNTIVVLDEAYQPFADDSWLERLRGRFAQYPHVVLMRTMSKLGLAGVRVGYMLGHTALMAEVDKVRPPYNISVLNAECARFALQYADVYADQAAAIRAGRDMLGQQLEVLGLEVFPSQANMLLVRHAQSQQIFDGLKQHGVLVKNLHGQHPLLTHCLRITVGTPDENQRLLQVLDGMEHVKG